MSAATGLARAGYRRIWRELSIGPTDFLSALLVIGCAMAIVFLVAVSTRAALHPWNNSLWDRRWQALTGAWSIGLVLLLFLRRPRLAAMLAWGIVSLIGIAAALFGGTLWSIVAAVWVVMIAAAWGDLILRAALRDQPVAGSDRIAFGVPIGFAIFGLMVFALAVSQALAFWSVNGLLLLLTVGLVWAWHRGGFSSLHIPALRAPGRLEAFVLGAAALFFAGGLLLAVSPEIKYDALKYQLAVPAQYVQAGGLVELPWNFRSYWSGNVTMIWAAALLVAGQPTPQVIHLLIGAVLVVQAYVAGARLLGATEGWVAALLLATTPIVQEIAGSSYVDVFAAAFTFGAMYASVRWFERRSVGWMVVYGVLAGGALGAKLNAAILLVPAGSVLLAAALLDRRGSMGSVLGPLLLGAGITAVIAGPWFALRWAWTGNPVFPFLNNVFRSPLWLPVNPRFDWQKFGTGTGLIPLVRFPWDITTNTVAFGEALLPGATGAALLLGLPVFLPLVRPARRRVVLVFAFMLLAAFAAWFFTLPYVRYGMALLPGFAVLAAGNLVAAYHAMARTRLAAARGAVALVLGGAYLWAISSSAAVSHWETKERYRMSVAFGMQTPDEFLAQELRHYKAFQWLNDQGDPDLRVLAASRAEELNLYLDGLVYVEDGHNTLPVDPLLHLPRNDPQALAAALQQAGFDYLLVDNGIGPRSHDRLRTPLLIDDRFLSAYAERKYADESYTVYRLVPLGAQSP